jgi:hypothetical protein
MPTLAGVDVPKDFLALVSRDALQSDATRATPVQITIFDVVSRGLAHYSFGLWPQGSILVEEALAEISPRQDGSRR